MKLSEVFTQLAYGELSLLSIGDPETGMIADKHHAQLVSHVNLGLTALYKRFNLKEGRVDFTLQAGRLTYPLTTAEDVLFVEDSNSLEFTDDILKVERVYTENGFELGLNDEANVYSCFTPSASVLRVNAAIVAKSLDLPDELKTSKLSVVYRANHPIIVKTSSFNPARVELELPYSHLEPLLLFVASRAHNPIGSSDRMHLGNNYAAKYEQACQQLEQTNIRVDVGSQPDRLHRQGWV